MAENQKNTVNSCEITKELQESYLDYAMSVIVSRALPDVRDGLKPVQRRILWDMWDSGLTHMAKFRKSANVIGQVLGRYHPHGDTAVYDALVRMAQDFSFRYPLVDGQGNFGSIDGDSAAAYRYTESRLSKISEELLIDIEKETIGWRPNYDGSRQEPSVLPAKLPGLLLNGSLGIAVGMTTNIPPHNLGEISDAILFLADNPNADGDELLRFVKGPDFPTGGVIFDNNAIKEAYLTGRGGITTRARADIEEKNNKQFCILITEIPYQVNKAELIKKIAELVQSKKIEGIKDLRDESGRDGLRIAIDLKNDVPPQKILNQLYKHTDLQKNFNLNMIALIDGIQPRLLSLKEILVAYLEYRKKVVRLRTEFELRKAEERAHILSGLAKALKSIDKIIETIKKSSDREKAKENLVDKFKFSEIQATAILEMRLQTLAALERQKIEAELKEKLDLIGELKLILKSPTKILQIIKNEVAEIKKKYGDERRTQVVASPLSQFNDEDLIPQEEAVITFSSGGYIKRLSPSVFRSQQRGGRGLIGSVVNEDDFLTQFFSAKTHDNLLFFTDKGRVFQTKAYEIPAASRTSKGRAIHNFLELPQGESVSTIIPYADNGDKDQSLVMVTKRGLVKKTLLEDFKNIRRTGIIAISLKKGDYLSWVRLSNKESQIFLITKGGQSIRFKESQVRKMGRTAAGVKAIRLKKEDEVAGFDIITKEDTKDAKNVKVLVVSARGFAKQTPLGQYKVQSRGGGGIITSKLTDKTGKLIYGKIIDDQTEVMALSAKGSVIRTELSSVRVTSRAAQGVKIINLRAGDRLAGVVVI